jgi:hypothetical protein
MADKYDEVRSIARQSLLPDFFGVRIDEENLFPLMQELVSRISIPQGYPGLALIKQLAADATDGSSFIEQVKTQNLWASLRELVTKGPVA